MDERGRAFTRRDSAGTDLSGWDHTEPKFLFSSSHVYASLLVIPLPTLRPVFSTGPGGEELASADTVVATETCIPVTQLNSSGNELKKLPTTKKAVLTTENYRVFCGL